MNNQMTPVNTTLLDDNHRVENNELDTTDEKYKFYDPRSITYKIFVMLFICLIAFGSHFDDISTVSLQDKIQDQLNISTTQFSLFYSLNAWPGVLLSFLGGYLTDRLFGIRLGTVIFAIVQFIGYILFCLGATIKLYWVMLVGRFIFGAGDESLAVAMFKYPVIWFKGKQLNMVFGLQMSIGRVASTLNLITIESIYEAVSGSINDGTAVGITLFIVSFAGIICLISAIILGLMDKRAGKVMYRQSLKAEEVIKISDIKNFKLEFWFVCMICIAFYVPFVTFIGLGKVFFVETFGLLPNEANQVNSLVFTISAVAGPFCGLLVDRIGRTVTWIFVSLISILVSFALLNFTTLSPFVGMSFMGVGYTIFGSVVWSLVPMMIPDNQLGTAYGIIVAAKNLGLAVFTIFAGMIVDSSGYFWFQITNMCIIFVSLICIVILWARYGFMNKSPRSPVQ